MYTFITLDNWDGETISPITVAYNERYNDVHDMNFTVAERFAPMFEIGQAVLLSWDTNKEFIVTGVSVNRETCTVTTKSTEYILRNRPAVPTVMATDWMDAEYPDGWEYGDKLNDIANIDILTILKDVFQKTTTWYQQSRFAEADEVDLVSLLGMSFGSEVTGKLAYYKVDGDILNVVTDLLNLSTNRLRLTTTRTDHSSGYNITFGSRKCGDRVLELLVDNYRSSVKSIKSNTDIGSTPYVVLRSDRDNVIRSIIHKPKRRYVTFDTIESKNDDSLSELELAKTRMNDLVYTPYRNMVDGYSVEMEFHGNLDLTNIYPGDTIVVNTNHPRPSWVPEELMISEIVRTMDHTGYREYPTLVTPTASFNRDLDTTISIKNSTQIFDGHSQSNTHPAPLA